MIFSKRGYAERVPTGGGSGYATNRTQRPVSAGISLSIYVFSKAPQFFHIGSDLGVRRKRRFQTGKRRAIVRLQHRNVPAFYKSMRDCSMLARPPHGSDQAVSLHVQRALMISLCLPEFSAGA
jgi:hypothetical protein